MIAQLSHEIEVSLANECYFSALALALMIPDACGKAEWPNKKSEARYKDWCDDYLDYSRPDEDVPFVNGEILYSLRCMLFHQSTPSIDKDRTMEVQKQVTKFSLCVDDSNKICVAFLRLERKGEKMVETNRELEVNIVHLCNSITKAAVEYYTAHQDQFSFIQYEFRVKKEPAAET